MVPDLYLDHDVSLRLAERLRARGYGVATVRDLGLERAPDGKHLLLATARGWLLLTHNERDFALLFDAWRRWSGAWGVDATHGGIVVLPHSPPPEAEARIVALLAAEPTFAGSLHRWLPRAPGRRLPTSRKRRHGGHSGGS